MKNKLIALLAAGVMMTSAVTIPPVQATDNAAITDTFDPILTALTVTFEGTPWTQGVQYNYNETTGLFTTVPGQILVPAATYTQDPVTGAYTANPGVAVLTVTGTI